MGLRQLATVAVALGLPASLGAQGTCRLASSTPEAKLLAFFAGPLAFSAVPGAVDLDRGAVRIIGELVMVPPAPSRIANSQGNCFGYSKPENSELSPVFPRPRIAIGLGNGIVVEASWLPPVTVADATPHLAGFALSWTPTAPLPVASARLTLRVHTTAGGVEGPITCPKSQLQQLSNNTDCFGTVPSADTYTPGARGVEAVANASTGTFGWQAGLGVLSYAPSLQVDFTSSGGFHDRNRATTSMTRVAVFGGVSYEAMAALALSAQVYTVPGDATTARLGLAWRVR